MDIHQATRSYETWVRRHIPVRANDLELKHQRMRESPFVFLRAYFLAGGAGAGAGVGAGAGIDTGAGPLTPLNTDPGPRWP